MEIVSDLVRQVGHFWKIPWFSRKTIPKGYSWSFSLQLSLDSNCSWMHSLHGAGGGVGEGGGEAVERMAYHSLC